MRHSYFGKGLSRNTDERKRLIRNVMRSLIEHSAIKTTRAKAQASRSEIEKLITKAKKGTQASTRNIIAVLGDRVVAQKLIDMSSTRFASRTSGYTRIIKLGMRVGDATEEVLFGFVDEEVKQEVIKPQKNEEKSNMKNQRSKAQIKKLKDQNK